MAKLTRKAGIRALFGQKHPEAPEAGIAEKEPVVTESSEDTERQLKSLLEALEVVRNGDLTIRLKKEKEVIFVELSESYNGVLDINPFANEVTRVAREVGTEGKLGGRAEVAGVTGTWKDLTNNVNIMAANLTNQVRNIADVTTGVAQGDLTKKITVEARSEIQQLKETIRRYRHRHHP